MRDDNPMMFLYYWLIAIMPLELHDIWGRQLFGNFTITKLVGALAFLSALGCAAWKGRWPKIIAADTAPFLVFIAIVLGNYFFHMSDLEHPQTVDSHVLSIIALFFTVLILVSTPARLHWSLLVAIGAIAFVSMHTIRQWQLYHGLRGFRPGGMLADSNYYAMAAGLFIPLAFLLVVNSRRPRWERLFCMGCLVLALLGTTFAASRGGFLGLCAAFLFVIWNSRRRARNLVICSLLLIPLSLLPMSPLRRLQNPSDLDDGAKEVRLIAWKAAWKMIQDHPITGVGLNSFKPLMPQYAPEKNIAILAHNTYIELTAELGFPGGLAFLAVVVTSFYRLDKVRRRAIRHGCSQLAITALGIEAGMISFAVSAMFLTAWWDKHVWLLIFSGICLERLSRPWLAQFVKRTRGLSKARATATGQTTLVQA
ncbi:MAG: O-antigen ligase family protein [Acidobacteriia bacterium]|nr:O-antigen ligase family protein [Terriglobia bacterium]